MKIPNNLPYWFATGILFLIVGLIVVPLLHYSCPYLTFDIHGSSSGNQFCDGLFALYFPLSMTLATLTNLLVPTQYSFMFMPIYLLLLFGILFFFGCITGIVLGKTRVAKIVSKLRFPRGGPSP